MKYKYIAYYGKNEVIVNEKSKPYKEEFTHRWHDYGRPQEEFDDIAFEDATEVWQKSCKPIPIAEGHGFSLEQFVKIKWYLDKSDKRTFTEALESGIILNHDVVRFEQRQSSKNDIKSLSAQIFHEEYAFFVSQEKETQLTIEEIFKEFEKLEYPSFGFGSVMLYRNQGSDENWNAVLRNPHNWKDDRLQECNGKTAYEAINKLYDLCIDLKFLTRK